MKTTRRQFLQTTAAAASSWTVSASAASCASTPVCTLENPHFRWDLAADGRTTAFVDKRQGKDYAAAGRVAMSAIGPAGRSFPAARLTWEGQLLGVDFRDLEARAVIRPVVRPHSILLEVVEAKGNGLEGLMFLDLTLNLKTGDPEPFSACALALNLKTNVLGLPRLSPRLQASCIARFGMIGAQAAIVAGPTAGFREMLQAVVTAAPELPHSPIGGPRALDAPINHGSYLFNFTGIARDAVDGWVALAKETGMNQIDFHGGRSFRFGDCRPDPKVYPKGVESVREANDRLRAAGIACGLHTYAFFIAKTCPWVTPVPDPRLASDARFTLEADLPVAATELRVAESTEEMSTITGFFVRNSVTLRIDNELVTYTGVTKQHPFAFTGCRRGAYGTRPAPHAKGAKVDHLKECFALFVPDPETTLFADVASATADLFNRGGFDMIYLDALDGEDILGGRDVGWHYGSRFAFEIWKRLERPALMEMSTFHHHLWYVRSRHGAWDHPNRSHKKFVDIHCETNGHNRRMFLPSNLGWWALKTWTNHQNEPTFADDIEYLMGKCLGNDMSLSLMGVDPTTIQSVPVLPRLSRIIRDYEQLRRSGRVPETIKARLRVPGDEHTLAQAAGGAWHFRPARHDRHRVAGADGAGQRWRVNNSFAAQPLRVRIEALMMARPYDSPEAVVVADFVDPAVYALSTAGRALTGSLVATGDRAAKDIGPGARFFATNASRNRAGTWVCAQKTFDPPVKLVGREGLGLWVRGDGQGEVLNIQLRSSAHLSHGIGDHYIPIDFTGWRYFELVEPEGARHAEYQWPYGGIYAIYREAVNYQSVERLSLWFNNLPAAGKVSCDVSPIKALPLASGKLIRPRLTIGGKTIVFPVEIESGCYLEFASPDDCQLFGRKGELLAKVRPEGAIPSLAADENEIHFAADPLAGIRPRAQVTVHTIGDPLPESIRM